MTADTVLQKSINSSQVVRIYVGAGRPGIGNVEAFGNSPPVRVDGTDYPARYSGVLEPVPNLVESGVLAVREVKYVVFGARQSSPHCDPLYPGLEVRDVLSGVCIYTEMRFPKPSDVRAISRLHHTVEHDRA